MTAKRLITNFGHIAEAPGCIHRLRWFILELAVRGKLVPQNPRDESVGELISRLRTEKARMVEEGCLRRPRDLEVTSQVGRPFPIPSTWQWVRLDSVGAIVGGGTPSSTVPENFAKPGEGIPWLTPADLGGNSQLYISRGGRDLSEKGSRESSATVMPEGTVLFTSRAPIGYVAIASNPISTNQGFKSIVPYVLDCSRFIATAMKAFAPGIDAKAPGTTFKEVSGKIVAAIPFPLPPLAEQHRIVAKVDELMALCDQLEAARAERERVRDRLTSVTLTRLSTSDAETFQRHAKFAVLNLPQLTQRRQQIVLLRRTILDLAVRGKLVSAASTGQSASEMLRCIELERAELVKNGELRREKPLPAVRPDDEPYEVPESWMWSRVGDAVLFTQYGSSEKSDSSGKGVPVLTMGNVQDGRVVCGNDKRIPETSKDLPALYLRKYDILYNRTNSAELVGKTGIYLDEDGLRTFASYLIRLRPSLNSTNPRYINIAMNSPIFRETQIVPLIKKQTGQANVNGSALKSMLIPLPPLREQHQIVAKVDELMTICDQLETSLAETGNNRSRLLDALLAEALAP
jgi:type I restriction enzyme S subunit